LRLSTLKEKSLLWLKVSKVPVHDQLTPLLLGLWQAACHGGEQFGEQLSHLMAARKQREGKWKVCPLKACPQLPNFLTLDPTS
jgi:hypothetical protein